MEVELNIRPVMMSESKAPATALKLVRIVFMRLPESEAMKLCVPVNVRTAPALSKPAPMQLPPRYWRKLAVPDPVVGSNEVIVLTVVL